MNNTLKVTLNADQTLKVPDANLDPDPHQEPQIIKWHREDPKLNGGVFLFRWVNPPTGGTFGPFENITGTKWATMADLHLGGPTATYPYRLGVRLPDGTEYWTPEPVKPIAAAGGNPNIKNN
jgi:hypothetical protein